VLTAYIIEHTGDWRLCFFVPAGMAVVGGVMLLIRLRDTPGSIGLPPVELYKGEESPGDLALETHAGEPYRRVVIENVLKNPFMWVISVANLLVYTLRYGTLNWGPTYLQELKGMSVVASGWLHFGNEMAGLVSALLGGIVADRVFRGRAGRVCVIAMAAMAAAVYLFWVTPPSRPWALATLYLTMGFMVYVPQMLIAAMAMNLGTKRAAAAAVGLTGIFGYASSFVTGWGLGRMVDKAGWDSAFQLMIGCAVGTLLLMAVTWNVGAHAHEKPSGPAPAPAPPVPARP
jgi:sugar phosphate permease